MWIDEPLGIVKKTLYSTTILEQESEDLSGQAVTHLEHLCQLSKHGTVSIVAETLDESIPPDTNQLSSCRYQECCCDDGGNEHLVRFDLINASHPETKASKPSRPGSTCSLPWTIVYLFCWFGLGTAQALCIRPGMYLFVVPWLERCWYLQQKDMLHRMQVTFRAGRIPVYLPIRVMGFPTVVWQDVTRDTTINIVSK
jgi:hypothetical protein